MCEFCDSMSCIYVLDTPPYPLKFHPKASCCQFFFWETQVLSNLSEYILFLDSDGPLRCNFTFCDFTFKYFDYFPQPKNSTLV